MTPLETLMAQRARLLLALGNNARSVEFEDRRIERFSPDELLTAIAGIDQQVAATTGQDANRMFVVASGSGLTNARHFCCGGGDVRDDRYEQWR
jgi:hypothetical protein